MNVEFYWGNLLLNAHLKEREGNGRITFTWSFGTYDVAGAGLYHVMFFVMCGVYPLDSADALTCILLLHLLAARLWDSRSSKSRVLRCYGKRLQIFVFKYCDFSGLAGVQTVANRTLPNKVTTYCPVTTVVSNAGTTILCSRCHVCTLVS